MGLKPRCRQRGGLQSGPGEELAYWPLSTLRRQNVFLVCKEALHNTIKHARADAVQISLRIAAHGFVLTLADNGCGFSLPEREAAGNGLANMRRRIREAGGQLEILTRPGQGTALIISIA